MPILESYSKKKVAIRIFEIYGRVFGVDIPDAVEISIDNL